MLYTFKNSMIQTKTSFLFYYLFTVLLFLGLYTFMTATTHAQKGLEGFTVASIELSNKFPSPGEKVKVSLKAPTIDMETALVTWSINGAVVKKAYSGNNIEFQVGNMGDVYRIAVEAVDGKNTRVTAEKIIRVSDVAVVWEGRTYTPPFYEGRALQSPGAEVAFHVIPSVLDEKGRLYATNELVYIWSTNYSSVTSGGKGISSVVLKNDQPLKDFVVNLQVKDPKGELRSVKKIIVPVSHPTVVLYEDSPLIGIRHDSALGTSVGVYGRESTLVAEPYYVSASTRTNPILEYTWSIDGTDYTNPGNLTFSPEGTASGSSYLNLVIKNTKYWLQNGRSSITINFGQRSLWGGVDMETTL
jgi:hypothetical protein